MDKKLVSEKKEEDVGVPTNDAESLVTHDSVFGQITTEGPNYRNVRLHMILSNINDERMLMQICIE